jgi:hypothetical protein
MLKDFMGKPFGEIVSKLVLGRNFHNGNVSSSHGIPKMMPLDMEIFGASSDALVCSLGLCTIVIFKDSAAD